MNCKQGDLAYIFKSNAGNYGRVVTCLELFPAGSFGIHERHGVVWRVDQLIKQVNIYDNKIIRESQYAASDCHLRPLRGDLTQDEIEATIKEIA